MLSFGGTRPSLAIERRGLRLACPTRVVKLRRNSMRRRGNRQQIDDHRFVKSGQPMIDEPGPLWRPMPIKRVAVLRFSVPIPLQGFPKTRDALGECCFLRRRAIEVLPRGEKTFDQERRFHEVPAAINHIKNRKRLTGFAVHKMRPRPMVARSLVEERRDPV